MIPVIYHEINYNPDLEELGTIKVSVRIIRAGDNLAFTTLSDFEDFIEDDCVSKEELKDFLIEAGLNNGDITESMIKLITYVDEVTGYASSGQSLGGALEFFLYLFPDDSDDTPNEETINIETKPASMAVVNSLPRKMYNKKNSSDADHTCTICLQEYTDGVTVVTLPCGHEFEDECIAKWFETNHVCPLCRFELPC